MVETLKQAKNVTKKCLFDRAKQSHQSEDWLAYRKARNCVNQMLEVAHNYIVVCE